MILTGCEPSVLRAGVMSGLALLGVLLGRPRSTWAILGAAVLILLLADPFLVASVGFQLSVAATVGMAALATPLSERFARRIPRWIALPLGTSLAAQLGVSPLLLYTFHQVPLVTIPANLLAFGAVAPALVLGLAAAAANPVFHPVAWILARLANFPLRYLEVLANRLARAPIPSVTGGGWAPLIAAPIVIGGSAWWLRSGRRMPRVAVFATALVFPVFVWGTALRAGPPSGLTIYFFDVGQGDSALVSSPGGANILIDAGPDKEEVAEEVATKVAELGVKRLDPRRCDTRARRPRHGSSRGALALPGFAVDLSRLPR